MKRKIASLMLALLLVASMAVMTGCGDKDKGADSDLSQTPNSADLDADNNDSGRMSDDQADKARDADDDLQNRDRHDLDQDMDDLGDDVKDGVEDIGDGIRDGAEDLGDALDGNTKNQ